MPRYDTSTLDERVVEMRIDNDNFEKGAKETISTLQKLEKALKIKSDSSAIDDISKSVRNFDASPMAENFSTTIDSISKKASFADEIIRNLARDIYDFGKQTAHQLVIEPIAQGMDKYTTLAETTQTLMAATKDYYAEQGITTDVEQLAKIEEILAELVWYTDETSYNFNDLASAMAKFAAVGVPLDQALSAMMGFSNWAASAGVKPAQASHALQYSIVQAMGTGYMGLADFKTLEQLNMATKEWKENLLELAAEEHILSRVAKDGTHEFDNYYSTIVDPNRIDELGYIIGLTEKEQENMFNWVTMRGSLNEKWLTSDLLAKLLAKYGEFSEKLYDLVETTGGIEVSEALDLLKDYREHFDEVDWEAIAKKLRISKDALLDCLEALDATEWKVSEAGFRAGQEYKTWQDVLDATRDAVSTQWMQTFKHIFGNFLEAKELWSEVGSVFYDAFVTWLTVQNDILEEWHYGGGRELLLGVEKQADGFRGAFWNIVDIILEARDKLREAFAEVFGLVDEGETPFSEIIGQKLIDITNGFREWTKELGFSEEALEGLKSIAELAFSIIKDGLTLIGAQLGIVGKIFSRIILPIADFLLRVLGTIFKPLNALHDLITGSIGDLNIYDTVIKVIDLIGDGLDALIGPANSVEECFKNIKGVIDAILGNVPDFEEIKNQLVEMSKGGSVDLSNRPVIDAKILKDAGWEEAGEGAATVFSSTFSNEAGTLAANFTPIIVDENGNYVGVLSPEELTEYAEGVIAGVREDDLHLQMGATFEGDDAIAQAVQAAETVHELHEQYFLSDGSKIISVFNKVKAVLLETYTKAKTKLIEWIPELSDLFEMFEGVDFAGMLKSIRTAFSDFGKAISEKVMPAIQTVKPAFEKLGSAFSTLWTKIKEGTTFEDVIDIIVGAFKDFGADIAAWFDPIKAAIQEKFEAFLAWLESIKPKLSEAWQGVIESFLYFGQDASASELVSSNPLLAQNGGPLALLPETVQAGVDNALIRIETIVNSFKTALGEIFNIDWSSIVWDSATLLNAIAAFKVGTGFNKFGKGFATLAKSFKNFSKFLNSKSLKKGLESLTESIKTFLTGKNGLGGLFSSLSSVLKDGLKIKHYDSIGTTILKIAGAIGVLVGAIYVLTKLDPDKVIFAMEKLGILAAGMVSVALIFQTLQFDGRPMLRMAAGLAILVGALWAIMQFPMESFWRGMARIGAMLLELAAFSRIAGGKTGTTSISAPFIKIAVALWILMKPIKQLAAMDLASLAKGISGLGAVMLEFGIFARSTQGLINTGGFIKMAVAIALLSYVASKLGEMDPATMLQGVIGLGAVVLEFRSLVKAANGMGKTSGFISMGVAVGIMSYALAKLGELDLWTAIKGIRTLGYVVKSLSSLLSGAKGMNFKSGITSLGTIAGTLFMLYWAFTYLNRQNLDFSKILSFTTSVAEICIGFGYMMDKAKAMSFQSAGATLTEFLGFIGIFGGILAALTYFKEQYPDDFEKIMDDVISVSNTIGRVIGELFGGFISGVGHGIFGDALDGFGEVVQTLIERFKEFLNGSFNLAQFGLELSQFMTNVQGFINGAKDIDPSIGANVGALATAILTITGSEFVNKLVESIANIDALDEFAIDITKLGNALSIASTSFAGIKKIPTTVETNVKNISKAITAVANGEFKKSWTEFLSLMEVDEEGNKVGSIDRFKTDVVKLGLALNSFATSIRGMPEGIDKDIDNATKAALGIAALNDSLPGHGGALQWWLGEKNLTEFIGQIQPLGEALKAYSIAIRGISSAEHVATAKDIKVATNLATGLSDLANSLPESGEAIWLKFKGWKSISNFSKDIEPLGKALKDYSIAIKDIAGKDVATEADIETATALAGGLADLENGLSRSGGTWQSIFGEQDITKFSEEIGPLGAALTTYAAAIGGIAGLATAEDSERAIAMGTSLTELVEAIGFGNGVELADFGSGLAQFGVGMRLFNELIKDIEGVAEGDPGSVSKAITLVKPFNEFLEEIDHLDTVGDRIAEFLNSDKYSELSRQLTAMKTMASDLKTFSDDMATVDANQVTNATTAMQAIESFLSTIDTSNIFQKIGGWFTGENAKLPNLNKTADAMGNFGRQFKDFSDGISGAMATGVNVSFATTAFDAFKTLIDSGAGTDVGDVADLFTTLEDMANFGTRFATFAEGISGAATAVANLSSASQAISLYKQIQNESAATDATEIISQEDLINVTTMAGQIPQAMANGVLQNGDTYVNAINDMAAGGETALDAAQVDFNTIGYNLAIGAANGLIEGSDVAVQAAGQMGSEMASAFASATGVASPSKVFASIAHWFAPGVAEGIAGNEGVAIKSVTTLGDQLIQAIQSSMAQVASMANQSFDFQPQITPVINMSNVRAGAAEYSSLFSGGRFGTMGMYSGISRSIQASQRAQQAYNSMLNSAPSAHTNPGENIVVNVYAAEGQSEESIADSVINRISAKSSRRSVAFG